jgi:hypothetical protein
MTYILQFPSYVIPLLFFPPWDVDCAWTKVLCVVNRDFLWLKQIKKGVYSDHNWRLDFRLLVAETEISMRSDSDVRVFAA